MAGMERVVGSSFSRAVSAEQTTPPSGGIKDTPLLPVALLRCGGYSLLALASLDLVETLIPLNFMNPTWEMQVMGTLIERSPVPLLGLLLLFCAEPLVRNKWEKTALKVLRFASLICGVVFLLMIPLLVTDTFRIETRSVAQIGDQLKRQIDQAEKLDEMLAQAGPQELETLLKRFGRSPEGANLEELKKQFVEDVGKAKRTIRAQAEEARSSQRLVLHKKLVKWGLQAMVSGVALIWLWNMTRSARRSR